MKPGVRNQNSGKKLRFFYLRKTERRRAEKSLKKKAKNQSLSKLFRRRGMKKRRTQGEEDFGFGDTKKGSFVGGAED